VVETGGIGYRLAIPLSTYTRLPEIGKHLKLFLSHVVREDAEILYAFLSKEERDLFEVLITISGIGPKTALAIIGHMVMSALQRAVGGNDVRLLSKIPGIGKKTAERLVIEMRDKFKKIDKPLTMSHLSDAVNALINLGYNPLEAQKAVDLVGSEEKDLGKVIAAALQKI
jgi:holliday junction DNA helicase RuvA